MRHTTHPDEKRPRTNNNNDCKQQKHKHHADSKQGNFAPNKPADSTQYGGGKSSTSEPLWNKLRKTKTNFKTKQLTTPDLFNPKGRDWLSARQISSCLTLLLHTKYKSAVHQAAIGSAHMVCSNKTLKVLLHDASQTSLPAHANFTQVLVDSCMTEGPCPSVVIGDNLHFRNICINAKTSTIDFVDPFGHGFPTEVRHLVQDFYDRHDGKSKWTYRTWSHIMQTDNYNCGIWSLNVPQTFRDSLQWSGPSPVVVFSEISHFEVVLMNAVSKMVTLFDPFGNGFPTPVKGTVKTFFDRDSSGSWTYITWTQKSTD